MRRPIPSITPDDERRRIVERNDGFYWLPLEGGREHGPFATLMAAMLDMQDTGEAEDVDPDDIRQAEGLLGVPDWVDPETGQLADDEWTRTEEH